MSAMAKPIKKRSASWRDSLIKRAQNQPEWWIEEVLGSGLWDKQVEICQSVVNHERTAVPASFGVGKTYIAARLALWFLYNHKPAKVVTTAPTSRQVKDLLWKELRTAHAKAGMKLGGEPLTLSLTLNDEQFAVGFSTDDTNMDMFTGYHSPNQFVVFDQAGGLPTMIWDAAEGLMTSGNCKWLAISNTAISDCEFANICMPERKTRYGEWNIIPIRAIDTPNVKAGKNVIPGLIAYDWVDRRRKAWGTGDPLYQIFVEARFVPTAQMLVIPYPYLLKAYDYEGRDGDVIEIGLDVATVGLDSTVWFARSGERALEIKRMTGNDEMGVAGETIEFVRYIEQKYQKPVHQIKVDVIGPGGGVYSRLIEQDLPVVPVNNAEVKIVVDRERYINVRAEMAWSLRYRFEHGGVGLAAAQTLDYDVIDMLKADLQIMKYKITSAGKIQILAKEDIRQELGRSPDYWDAMVMAYESPGGGPPMVEFMSGKEEQGNVITSKVLTDEEWKAFVGQQVDIDDPSFHEVM